MVRPDRIWTLALLAMLGGPAQAEDEPKADGGIQRLLDSIPEIKAPTKEGEEDKPPEPLDYNTYNQLCANEVMVHFKPPRGIVKKHPSVEFQVMLTVDMEGQITGLSANHRSGHRSFDAAAMNALNEAGGCPQPPLGWNVVTDRVILAFNATSAR
jgi:hypothetical protein